MKHINIWIAVDANGDEYFYSAKPEKRLNNHYSHNSTLVTKGTSLTLTGKQMTFDDEPFELTISAPKSSNLEDLIKRNYEATVRRGLITPQTTLKDFIAKMREEVDELEESLDTDGTYDKKEAFDCFLTPGSMLYYYGLFDQLEEKVIINEKRAEMSLEQANQILIDHKNYMSNGSGEIENTLRLGMAIEIVTNHINKLSNGK